MKTQQTITVALAIMFSAGLALADGPSFKGRVGAFGKGGPRALESEPVLVALSEQSPPAATGDKYVCPMKCAGSESQKPGKCPKCGMELEKAAPAKPGHKHGSH